MHFLGEIHWEKKKKKKENTTSGSLPIRHANVWRALLERRTSRHPAETAADQSAVDAQWHRITKGRVSHEQAGRRLKRADVSATPRAALNANTGSLNATKSIRKTITRRRRRIYTLPFVEDDTNWGLLLMVIISSVGGSGFLTGPLLLRVLRASPKLNSGFHTQPEKSQPIIPALNINLDRWLINWALLSSRSLLSSSQSTAHQQKNSKENTPTYLVDSRRLSEVLEDDLWNYSKKVRGECSCFCYV